MTDHPREQEPDLMGGTDPDEEDTDLLGGPEPGGDVMRPPGTGPDRAEQQNQDQ
jgi:hypothetical protein